MYFQPTVCIMRPLTLQANGQLCNSWLNVSQNYSYIITDFHSVCLVIDVEKNKKPHLQSMLRQENSKSLVG